VSLFIDNEFAFGLPEDVAVHYGLAKGMILSVEEISSIRERAHLVEAKLAAERFIGHRLRSEHEVRLRLARNDVPTDIIERVLEDFRRVSLLDDRRFAQAYVADKLRFNPVSKDLLHRELRKRGVEKSLIEEVLAEQVNEETEKETARTLASSFMLRLERCQTDVRKRRMFAYLRRRGFTSDLIRDVLREFNL